MSVSTHLGIAIGDYDRRIRTFIPKYDEMIDAAAAAIGRRARVILDLGVGTGALAARCLTRAPGARVVGLDADAAMLSLAAERLPANATLTHGNFLRTALPRADAVIASFALHHVRTRDAKARLYRRIRRAIGSGGVFVSADCFPAPGGLAGRQREAWLAHLRESYSARESEALLEAWSREDVYQPLDVELALLGRSGLSASVVWRREAFAVLKAAIRPPSR